MSEPTQQELQPVAPEELAATYSVPAIFANRFFISAMGPLARVTFGEQQGEEGGVVMRSAVLLSTADLVQLRDLLQKMLKDVQTIVTPANG